MRTKRTIINLMYTLGSSFVLLLLGLVARALFVSNFDISIPGTSTVIEQLFSVFSIAEFGVGSVISYRLYEQIAAKDVDKISKYMSLYKWTYRLIGGAIFVLAAIFWFLLPLLIVEANTDWDAVHAIYILQTLSTLSSYFLVTRRLLYTCTQQGYVCTRIDFVFNVLTYLARIYISLNYANNYILYFGITILFNTLANVVVAWRYRRDFPEVHDVRVSWKDFRELGLFRDLRYYLVHRVSNAIYGTSDSLVMTRMRGSASVTYLGNYSNVSSSVTNIGNKILDSFAAAIGNIVYDKTAEADDHQKKVFWSMDLFSYLFGSFVAVAYFCLFQPFVTVWLGSQWLLPMSYVFWFCLNEYVGWNHRMLGSYRAVLGHFEEDQWFMVASGVSNLVLSFVLVIPFGLPGVIAATVFAHCLMWFGRAKVVFRRFMRGCGGRYVRIQLTHALTLAVEMALTWWVCSLLGTGWLGISARAGVVCILPNAMNLVFYGFTSDAEYLRGRALQLWQRISARRKEV